MKKLLFVLLLMPAIIQAQMTSPKDNLVGFNTQLTSYILNTEIVQTGYAENISNSGLEGEFFYKRNLNEKSAIQIGLGASLRVKTFYDFVEQELIQSREEFISIPIVYYRRFRLSTNIEFQIGSGIYYHSLDYKEYFTRSTVIPIKYIDTNESIQKIGVTGDFPVYYTIGNKGVTLSHGFRFGIDFFPRENDVDNYFFWGGYIGVGYKF